MFGGFKEELKEQLPAWGGNAPMRSQCLYQIFLYRVTKIFG